MVEIVEITNILIIIPMNINTFKFGALDANSFLNFQNILMDKFPDDLNKEILEDKINEEKEKQKKQVLSKYRKMIYTEFKNGNIYPFEINIENDFTDQIYNLLDLELNARQLSIIIIASAPTRQKHLRIRLL